MSVNGDEQVLVQGRENTREEFQRVEEEDLLDLMQRWALKALLVLTAVGVAALSVAAAMLLAWRWSMYGVRCVRDVVFGHFSDMYRWLDQYSPSETEEERQEKFLTLRARIKTLIPIQLSMLPTMPQLDWLDLLVFTAVVVLIAGGLYGSLKLSAQFGRQVILRVRGIQLEAMQPGSLFSSAQIPACQIQVMIPGLLSDVHQGYGTRTGDYMVTNAHVVGAFSELILRGPSGRKILMQPSYVKSRLSEDLVYVWLGPSICAQLGAKIAPGSTRSLLPGFATCVGPSGASTGRVSKASIRGKLIYEGSTVPGMSGAPYLIQGVFVGIHQGAAGHSNIGISAEVVKAEAPRLVSKESTHSSSPSTHKSEDPTEQYQSKFSNAWKYEELEKMAADRYSDDSWADFKTDDGFWERDLGFESAKKRPKAACISIAQSDGNTIQVPMSLHSPQEGEQVLDLMPANAVDFLATLREGNIVERVEALEKELSTLRDEVQRKKQAESERVEGRKPLPAPVSGSLGPVQRYPCSHCSHVCKTEDRLERHLTNSHFRLESALAEDTGREGKVVRQGKPFLGRRALSPQSGKNLKSTSPLKAKKALSPSLEESLLRMIESQQNTEILLKRYLQASAGPSSAIMQS
uniref:Trypsin-like serine protease n=1 Tax=Scaphoideus titanus sobemo-like virus 1 TaxID=2716557 RepID=A0A6G7NS61_9VIRU|nr:trypsin-like serine protease [Scaphoideus titanus sobemo-like virus 1]